MLETQQFQLNILKIQNVSRTFQVSLLAVSTVSRSQVSLYLNQLHAAWAEHNPQLCACAAHLSSVRLDMLLIFIIDCIDHLSEFLMRSLFSLSLFRFRSHADQLFAVKQLSRGSSWLAYRLTDDVRAETE